MKKNILTAFDFQKVQFPNAHDHNLILSELQEGKFIKKYNEAVYLISQKYSSIALLKKKT
jgi:hypothetical protein